MTRTPPALLTLGSFVLLLALPTACNTGPSEEEIARARQDCETLIDRWCSRVDTCGGDYADCSTRSKQEIDCADVIGIDDDFDSCLQDIDASACSAIDALPASCNSVLLLESQG